MTTPLPPPEPDRADPPGPPAKAPTQPAPAVDPVNLIRSRQYRMLVLLSAVIGVLVSFSSWCFLQAVNWLQHEVFEHLPADLGFDTVPWWWPIPPLALAGLLVAIAVLRLPGEGGHKPYRGLSGGMTMPVDAPGVLLAALASLSLGVVLGPEAPLIALASALAIFAVRLLRRDLPDQALTVIAASAAFAALATIFGSPIIGAVILLEATGLGGAMLPVVLLPGLTSAGIGSLIFIGMNNWTGLSTGQYSLTPFSLPTLNAPTYAEFGWTLALSVVVAVVTFAIVRAAAASASVVARRPWILLPAAGVVIALLAIIFAAATPEPFDAVLFSGQDAFTSIFTNPDRFSIGTLVLLLLLKSVAWSVSLGSFRGGPTFPALFLGAVAGLLAAKLPGFSETPAVAGLMTATAVSMLRLPLSSIIIVMVLTAGSGAGTAPIIIVAAVVAYLVTQNLIATTERRGHATASVDPAAAASPAAT